MMFSKEAEMAALGACFWASGLRDTRSVLKPSDFASEPHREIYEVLCRLTDRKVDPDLVTISAELGPKLVEVGGVDYIIALMEYTPSPAAALSYAALVRDCSERRALAECASSLANACRDESKSIEEVREVAANVTVTERTGNPFFHLKDIDSEVPDIGVTTGFTALDEKISTKGYPAGQVSVVSAYHKGGKSTFMMSSFVAQASLGLRVVYATFSDLNAKRVKKRFMRNVSGWSHRPNNPFHQEGYDNEIYKLETELQAYVFDCTQWEDDPTIESFRAWLKSQHARTPFDCVFVDYAQKIGSSDRKATNPFTEAAIVSKKLSRLAEQTGLPIVVGSQITEGGKDGRTRTKNGRGLEEDAGWVLRLEREGETSATVEVAYSRFGPQGIELPFTWNNERLRFEE